MALGLLAATACLGKGWEAAGAHVIRGGLGEAGGGGGLPAAYRQGSQLCHRDSAAGGQGSSRAAVPTPLPQQEPSGPSPAGPSLVAIPV